MSKTLEPQDVEFGEPATYRIVVQGSLSNDWSSHLGGIDIVIIPWGPAATER